MFDKPLREWTPEDVLRLRDENISEDYSLEFKSDLPMSSSKSDKLDIWHHDLKTVGDTARNEIAKEIVAFANTAGGLLVIGAVESQLANEPNTIKELKYLPSCVALADALRLSCRDLIEPKLDFVEYVGIPMMPDGAGVVLIRTMQSRLRPHRLSRNKECYFRRGESSVPMTMEEIRNLVLYSVSQEQRELALFTKRKQELTRLLGKFEKERSIRISSVMTPMDTFYIPNITKNRILQHPSITFPIRLSYGNSTVNESVEFAFKSTTDWKPTLRGIQAYYEEDDFAAVRQMFEDGSVCFGFASTRPPHEKSIVAAHWVCGLIASALYSIELGRKVANAPEMSFAVRSKVELLHGDAAWEDFDRSRMRTPTLRGGSIDFPPTQVRSVDEFNLLVNSIDADIWNYAGYLQPRTVSIEWEPIIQSLNSA